MLSFKNIMIFTYGMETYNNTNTNISIELVLKNYLIILLVFFLNFIITAMGLVLVYNKIQKQKNTTNMVSASKMYNIEK